MDVRGASAAGPVTAAPDAPDGGGVTGAGAAAAEARGAPAIADTAGLGEHLARRTAANAEFFGREAERLARLCHRMAERFARGGRLVALGASPQARSDARHIAVEFVHPVIVGKRALPALGLAPEGGPLARQVETLVGADDIVVAFGADEAGPAADAVAAALAAARARGALTVAFADGVAEWPFEPPSADPFVRQELVETLYHVVWELVHVFFEHRGLLEGRAAAPVHDVGASGFLYPFLRQAERDLDGVLADVRASVLAKAADVAELRARTIAEGGARIAAAAAALRDSLDAGGALLAFGNGGSATDAMDVVADLRAAPQGWPARRALDLTEDSSILTAIANDVGVDAIFARQIIAYGKPGDVALALSTSGGSRNIIRALEEARRRGLRTIALVGYDGGRILAERLADDVVVAPSQHIPRIQEAQATAYHLIRELVER
ncbi:MAG: SIS domain-containing protein [Gemmatimonadetes bacterium]|nr:SIS domain-containing protein [Gemmatimonadota bacterium]